jgi:hypothetical protein
MYVTKSTYASKMHYNFISNYIKDRERERWQNGKIEKEKNSLEN